MGSFPVSAKFHVSTEVDERLTRAYLEGECFNAPGDCQGQVGWIPESTALLCCKHAAKAGIAVVRVPVGSIEETTEWEVTRWENVPSIGAQVRGLLEGVGNLPLRCPNCGETIPSSRSSRMPQDGPPELTFYCPNRHEFILAVGEKVYVPA